jgi:hypothetical protein
LRVTWEQLLRSAQRYDAQPGDRSFATAEEFLADLEPAGRQSH